VLQINDRYEFYDTLDLDREDGKYLSPQVRSNQHRGFHDMTELVLVLTQTRFHVSVLMGLLSVL
jgi:hypothetical protein